MAGPAISLAGVAPVGAGITVGPINPDFWTFRLFANASGDGTGDPRQAEIDLSAPPGASQFNPNDATGTLSDTGPDGTATGSAAGAAFTNFSLANDVLTAHATVAFNTNATFATATLPHDQFAGGSGQGQYEFDLPIQTTGGLYEYSYSVQITHDIAGDTGGFEFGRVHFFGSPSDFINLDDQHHTGSGTTSVSDRGVIAPNANGSLSVSFDASTGAGLGDSLPHHGNGTLDVQFTLRPANQWKNPAGGSFQSATNWTGNLVPGASDVAVFNLPGTYSVQLDQPATNATLHASGSGVNVTFDVAGHPYTVDKLEVGGNPGDNVHFSFIDSGGIVTAARGVLASTPPPLTLSFPGSFNVGTGGQVDIGGATSAGTVNVNGGGVLTASGADAQWLVQSLLLGAPGAATFNVSNKATVTSSFANVGVGAPGNATATVSDAIWNCAQMTVGGQGTGSLRVSNNGALNVSNLAVGSRAGSSGTITVGGTHDPNLTSFLLVQDNGPTAVIGDAGAGHLQVQNNGVFAVVDGTLNLGGSGGGVGDATVSGSGSTIGAETLIVGALGTGSITVSQGGLLGASGHRTGKAVIGTSGTVTLTSAGQFIARTTLQVDGRLSIDSTSEADVGDDSSITSHAPGRLFIAPGGTLLGSGTITVPRLVMLGGGNNFGGTLKPGHSPGTLTINGDLEQDPGSTIKIEIAGNQPGQFDVLNVTGNASYAGDLLLSFQDGFAPRQGDTFAFLNTAGTTTGSFANVRLHDLAPGFQFDLQPEAGGTVALVALNDGVSTRIPGDANDDGKVDFSDLLTLAQHYNQDGTYSTGDFNLDGTVDFTDLLTLAQHYGQTAAPEQVASFLSAYAADWRSAFAPVPEPGTGAVVGIGCTILARRRRPLIH